jgi:hypothetical protein
MRGVVRGRCDIQSQLVFHGISCTTCCISITKSRRCCFSIPPCCLNVPHIFYQKPDITSDVSCNHTVEPEVVLVVDLRSDDLSGLLEFISTDAQHLGATLYLLTENSQLATESLRHHYLHSERLPLVDPRVQRSWKKCLQLATHLPVSLHAFICPAAYPNQSLITRRRPSESQDFRSRRDRRRR